MSALNRHAGAPVLVSPETLELVERALDAWRMTHGWFDPTVLGARRPRRLRPLVRRDRPELPRGRRRARSRRHGRHRDPGGRRAPPRRHRLRSRRHRQGPRGRHRRRRAPRRRRGGRVREPRRRHAGRRRQPERRRMDGRGRAPRRTPERSPSVGIRRGAVATSTTLRRRWRSGDELRHHLIDPTTGLPSWSDAHVRNRRRRARVDGRGVRQGAVLHGAPARFDDVDAAGAAALAVDDDGHVIGSARMRRLPRRAAARDPRDASTS